MLRESYNRLLEEISRACHRVGRDPREVTLVAITKKFSPETIREALKLGIKDLGENRMQEAVEKIKQLPGEIRWHFVGHLQSNKAGDAVKYFNLIHSLDRLRLARDLDRRASGEGKRVKTLVQLNVSGERSKHGLPPGELEDFLIEVRRLKGIAVEGLMTMAPLTEDPEEVRPFFRRLRELRDSLEVPGISLRHLSMGMSGDYTVALEEGATMIRIGTALFGPRI